MALLDGMKQQFESCDGCKNKDDQEEGPGRISPFVPARGGRSHFDSHDDAKVSRLEIGYILLDRDGRNGVQRDEARLVMGARKESMVGPRFARTLGSGKRSWMTFNHFGCQRIMHGLLIDLYILTPGISLFFDF